MNTNSPNTVNNPAHKNSAGEIGSALCAAVMVKQAGHNERAEKEHGYAGQCACRAFVARSWYRE